MSRWLELAWATWRVILNMGFAVFILYVGYVFALHEHRVKGAWRVLRGKAGTIEGGREDLQRLFDAVADEGEDEARPELGLSVNDERTGA